MINRVAAILFVSMLTGLFFLLDRNISTISDPARWVVFFPISLLLYVAKIIHLQEDYKILLILLFGFPALLFYWAFLVSFFSGERFRREKTVINKEA